MERQSTPKAADGKNSRKGKGAATSRSQPPRRSARLKRSTEVKVEVIVLSSDSSDLDEVDEDYAEFLKVYKPQDTYPHAPSSRSEEGSQNTVESKPLVLVEVDSDSEQ
ncbi:hypothetical protein L195_g026452 [Trifolium pratense]|uniref:Uncharacterized protein n=1 Tax=Trifolium pratense TaxID=57577 RepID=A0A2K3NJF5_TRIPR|nr:hypothetical protein L195_g026452 [Trifolium pratense]